MENKAKQSIDQAERLKLIFSEQNTVENDEKIDVLNLPPRKTVHAHNKKGFKVRLSRPLIRLLSVSILILLVVAIVIYYLWKESFLNFISI